MYKSGGIHGGRHIEEGDELALLDLGRGDNHQRETRGVKQLVGLVLVFGVVLDDEVDGIGEVGRTGGRVPPLAQDTAWDLNRSW